MPSLQRALIIANPTAGAGAGRVNKQRLVEIAKRDLERSTPSSPGLQVKVAFDTNPQGVVEPAASAVAQSFDIVVAAGGDGTVNAVVNGLMQVSLSDSAKRPVLGVLPMGTGNVLAYNLNLPRSLRDACRVIRAGTVRQIDVGLAHALNETDPIKAHRHFVLMAGVGFDAKVMEDTSLRLKYVLRDFAYVLKSLQNAVVHQGTEVTLHFKEGFEYSTESWMIMVGNAASYAWDIKFTSHARMDDSMVDVCLMPYQNKLVSVQQVMQILTGQHIEKGSVRYWKTRGVRIESNPPVPVQLDGDEWSRTPIDISMQPSALKVLAPPTEAI